MTISCSFFAGIKEFTPTFVNDAERLIFDLPQLLLIEFIYMHQRRLSCLARVSSAFLLFGLLSCAQAVELGDALVRSHLGQPLSADIELTGIANEAATVQAAVASADVYGGANIAMHPALSALNITIVRREGRRFLHIASSKLVESEFVNIFFELTENGRRSVRQTTLWFTPDPHPASPKAPAVLAAVAPAPVATSVKVPAVAAEPRAIAAAVIAPVLPAPAARHAACVQQFTAAQIGTCAALDAKNAALSAQIVELEEKVRLLTVAVHARTAEPPLIKAIPAQLAPMAPSDVPATKPAAATPWLFIAIASAIVLSLVGVLVYFLLRKRKAAKAKSGVKAGAGFIASVKNRLLPAKKGAERTPDAAPVEV
jgi:pilus assembly protein FimV